MLQDVEDIREFWDKTGLLRSNEDPTNLALLLETQRRSNDKIPPHGSYTFKRVSFPTIVKACREDPEIFIGLIDTSECNDVYRLGRMPEGSIAEIVVELTSRILQLGDRCLYFGGMVLQNNRVYLLTDKSDL